MPWPWTESRYRAALMAAVLMLPNLAHAQDSEGSAGEAVDAEHIFGFTEGSDIGEKGEKEVDHSSYMFLGKQGSFVAIVNGTDFRYGVDKGFRASFNFLTDYHGVYNSPGIPDRAAFAFSGLSSELDWALLEREKAPFGLTFVFTPQCGGWTTHPALRRRALVSRSSCSPTSRFRQTNGSPPPT